MRKGAENQGHTLAFNVDILTFMNELDVKLQGKNRLCMKCKQTTLKEYFSARIKATDTPMKPSQVTNWLLHPPPRRILPLHHPELCTGARPSVLHQSSNPMGPIHSSGISSLSHPVSPHTRKDLKLPLPSHVKKDQVTNSLASSNTERKDTTVQRQESTKGQQNLQTTTSERLKPVELNCSSQKRPRDFGKCDVSVKRPCPQKVNSLKALTPKCLPSTSLLSQTTLRCSSDLELSRNHVDDHLLTESACGQHSNFASSSTFTLNHSSCALPSPKPCVKARPSTGVKQAYMNSSYNHIVKLREVKSPSKLYRTFLKKGGEDSDRKDKTSTVSTGTPQKSTGNSSQVHSDHKHISIDISTKTINRDKEETKKLDIGTHKPVSKSDSGSYGCRLAERNKISRLKRNTVIPDDIDALFTPDPMTYVISPAHKTAKPKMDEGQVISLSLERSCSDTSNGSLCLSAKASSVTASTDTEDTKFSFSAAHPSHVSLPTVSLVRVQLETPVSPCSKNSELKNNPASNSCNHFHDENCKAEEKCRSFDIENVIPHPSKQSSTLQCHRTPPPNFPASEGDRKHMSKVDPVDMELDLGLSFALDLDLTQSSYSSDEEQLLSLQEMMERVTKLPDTPEKGSFSEPSTPGNVSCQLKCQQPLPSTAKTGIYKNNLDQMLKEIKTQKKAKENETQLLNACQEELSRIAEYEETEENQEEQISTEQQEFLQRYSLTSSAIREVPPGEVVFNLEKFGQIFNQDTLQLRQFKVTPHGTAQKTLLWSSPAQLRLHVNSGLFQEAYGCLSPCPAKVTQFLFKMMSVHSERMVSGNMLQALCDIASNAAYQIVKNGSQLFQVWVPGLADITLALMNMGAPFVALFPFENLQPCFTEGDLLDDVYIQSESPSSKKEMSTFPLHNCENVMKYLSFCMGLCPRVFSDDELLLLLTVMGKVGLDTRLILHSNVELNTLQYKIVNNIRDWDSMLPRICQALTDLTDDHHNMCQLVHLLPDHTRGKQLQQHLSLCMISKLLDGTCKYRPTEIEFQLAALRPYLPRMQPSLLLRGLLNSLNRSQNGQEDDMVVLDQQSYYLCYSLLTLANEASNYQFFPSHQKEQLLILCSDLETHVKCDIREGEKCLYRSKVKDLVARIDTKWQMILQRTRLLRSKLYDYWQPLPMDILPCGQEEQVNNAEIGGDPTIDENHLMGDAEAEMETCAESEVAIIPEEEGV